MARNFFEKYCDRCGKPIVIVRMTSGRYMPADWRLVNYREDPKAKGRVVTRKGKVIAAQLNVDPREADGRGYITHFATCEAELARKRKLREERAAAKAAARELLEAEERAARAAKPPKPARCHLCGAELPPDGKCDCWKYQQTTL